jgi:hypothetical protein
MVSNAGQQQWYGGYPRVLQTAAQWVSDDQVIRENPASRGTEASAEVLVGPPLGAGGLLNAGQQQRY